MSPSTTQPLPTHPTSPGRRRRAIRLGAAAALLGLALPGASAGAQDASKEDQKKIEELQRQVQELQARLDSAPQTADVQGVVTDLENFKYQYQRDRETKSARSTRNLLIGGIVQTRGAWHGSNISATPSSPVPTTLANTSVNNPAFLDDRRITFDIPNAIVTFSGLLYRDYEKARNLGFSLSTNAQPVAGSNLANLSVLDANVTYHFLPTIENDGPRLSATLGQQILPFGLESNTTEELRPVINGAQFVGQTGLGQRQIGLVVRGEFFTQYDFGYNYRQALLALAAGVVNGTGPNRDADKAYKDVVARVAITIPAEYNSLLRELRFGASAYFGKVLLTDATATSAATRITATGTRNRFGGDVYYNHFPLGLTYEYVRALDDTWSASANQTVRFERESHTATVFYSFGEQFLSSIKNQGKFDDWWPKTYQPFVRYDRWTPDVDNTGSANEIFTGGINIFFAETTKAQVNYNRRIQHVIGKDDVTSEEVLAQIQFGF